jgi:hypothetical protein
VLRPVQRNELLMLRGDRFETDDFARQGALKIGVALDIHARPHRADIDILEPWQRRQDGCNGQQRILRDGYFARV